MEEMTAEPKIDRASESDHWYFRDGTPCYQMTKANGDGMRATTIRDARALNLVPSVTKIIRVLAAPGLEAWKDQQLLEASLTLPIQAGEVIDDYAKRVIADSKERAERARDMGTEAHGAIERFIRGDFTSNDGFMWGEHLRSIEATMRQAGLDLRPATAERTFACELGYGGKIDWDCRTAICDFKTKDTIDKGKRHGYDEHVLQLAAYVHGRYGYFGLRTVRALNVFVGVKDAQVLITEWTGDQLTAAFDAFKHILEIWKWKNNFHC